MLFLFESPLESRFLNIKQVVNLTLSTQEMREKAAAILPSLKDAAQWLELT